MLGPLKGTVRFVGYNRMQGLGFQAGIGSRGCGGIVECLACLGFKATRLGPFKGGF